MLELKLRLAKKWWADNVTATFIRKNGLKTEAVAASLSKKGCI